MLLSAELCTGAGTFVFSAARKAKLKECWISAIEVGARPISHSQRSVYSNLEPLLSALCAQEIVIFMTAGGKFPIPSTNGYIGQYSEVYTRQRDVLAKHGGFK